MSRWKLIDVKPVKSDDVLEAGFVGGGAVEPAQAAEMRVQELRAAPGGFFNDEFNVPLLHHFPEGIPKVSPRRKIPIAVGLADDVKALKRKLIQVGGRFADDVALEVVGQVPHLMVEPGR